MQSGANFYNHVQTQNNYYGAAPANQAPASDAAASQAPASDATASQAHDSEAAEKEATDSEQRVKKAILAVSHDSNFLHLYDWSWVRIAMADNRVGIRFSTNDTFLSFLHGHGINQLPNRSVLSRYMSKAVRTNDGYTFTDTIDRTETIRRNNIIRRFISAYIK